MDIISTPEEVKIVDCPKVKTRIKRKLLNHCPTCSCEAPRQCSFVVPASAYRSRGRCQKKAKTNSLCCTHRRLT